jgi:hypothetical protein
METSSSPAAGLGRAGSFRDDSYGDEVKIALWGVVTDGLRTSLV